LKASFPASSISPSSNGATDNGAGTLAKTNSFQLAQETIGKDEHYFNALSLAGSSATCLIGLKSVYQTAARAAVQGFDPDLFTTEDLRKALADGAASVLSSRYAPTDRFGLVFGIGVTFVLTNEDRNKYKIVSRGESGQTQDYIVKESQSSAAPAAVTGMVVRFRDRNAKQAPAPPRDTGRGFVARASGAVGSSGRRTLDFLFPTSTFASVQFGAGAVSGPLQGASLGLGWR
jgi:hypothetical protein